MSSPQFMACLLRRAGFNYRRYPEFCEPNCCYQGGGRREGNGGASKGYINGALYVNWGFVASLGLDIKACHCVL